MIINENILKKYLSTSIPKNLKFLINNHITEVDKIIIFLFIKNINDKESRLYKKAWILIKSNKDKNK
ncbi:hypothetical protein ACGRWE_01900 [Candidatus Phytoplasma australasiaticum]